MMSCPKERIKKLMKIAEAKIMKLKLTRSNIHSYNINKYICSVTCFGNNISINNSTLIVR